MGEFNTVLLGLAPITLRSLFFMAGNTKMETKIIRKLSYVTELLLFNKALDVGADCGPLQHLPLERLILVDCPCADSAILAPGSFEGLKWLHIDGCERDHRFIPGSPVMDPKDSGYFTDSTTYSESKADRMSRIIQDLPQLNVVSGRSALFFRGMFEFLKSGDWSGMIVVI